MIDTQLVAYVGPFAFPNGGAAARRILGNAKALRDGGYKVIVGSGQMPESGKGTDDFEGFEVFSVGERTAENYPNALRYLSYLKMGEKTVAWLDGMKAKPAVVILYSGYSPYLRALIPWCKYHGIKLIFDAVEWYDPKTPLHWFISPYHWNTELAMRFYVPRTRNIISISNYLHTYYQKKGCNSARIPPLVDLGLMNLQVPRSPSEKLVLSYSGSPGYKDLFNVYLESILQLDPNGELIKLEIAGVSKRDLISYPALKKRNLLDGHPCFNAKGVVTYNEALDTTRNSDFSLLLRKPKRFAMAGFPTKLVESLSLGTPLIANITSDVGEYLDDTKNSIICSGYCVDNMKASLQKALSLTFAEKEKMKHNARETGKKFDYRKYSSKISDFIKYAQ